MNILVSRTLYMSCQAEPGIEPGPSALKASALPIELTWQTTLIYYLEGFRNVLLMLNVIYSRCIILIYIVHLFGSILVKQQ